MEKNMETTVMGLCRVYGFRLGVQGSGNPIIPELGV